MIPHLNYNKKVQGLAVDVDNLRDQSKPFALYCYFDGERAHVSFIKPSKDFVFQCCEKEQAFLAKQEASKAFPQD